MVNRPKFVIVHCSDSPDWLPGDPKFDSIGAKEIDQWHRERGWQGIGYHWVIRQSGVLEPGRPEIEIGAHCKLMNWQSIGVCLVGRGQFQDVQKVTLVDLFHGIQDRWKIPAEQWHGHYEYDCGKTCPNVKIEEVRRWLTTPAT